MSCAEICSGVALSFSAQSENSDDVLDHQILKSKGSVITNSHSAVMLNLFKLAVPLDRLEIWEKCLLSFVFLLQENKKSNFFCCKEWRETAGATEGL